MKTTINGVEYETFEEGENSKELGIDTSRKFIVCDGNLNCFDTGDIVILNREDNDPYPAVKLANGDGDSGFVEWSHLAYYDEPTHKFKVGDRVKALIGRPKGEVGKVVFVSREGKYAVKFEDWDKGHHCFSNNNPIDCGDSGFWMDDDKLELVEKTWTGDKKTYYSSHLSTSTNPDTIRHQEFNQIVVDEYCKSASTTEPDERIIITSSPYGRGEWDILRGHLEEDNKRMERIILKTKPNIMTRVINGLHTSKEDKALAYFDLSNQDGTLNGAGQSEFTDFIYNSGSTDKKEFLAKIVEAHKEAIKK